MSEVTPEQLKDLGKGGIWKDENLAQDLDWAGEQGAPSASINDEATHIPLTERQQEDQLLALHKIAPETIAILTKRIQQSLLASGDSKDSSVVGMMERKLAEKEKEIDRWMEKKEQEMMRKEVTADEIEKLRRDLSRLEEKFETLDTRLNHNLILATKQGSEEASVLHEVRTMLKERRAVDESETGSLPSIVDRLEARTDQILNTLTIVEEEIPRAEQSITADLNVKRNVRKKFGKKF